MNRTKKAPAERSGRFILTSTKGDVIAQLRRMIAAEERCALRPIPMRLVPKAPFRVPCNDNGVAS